MGTISVSLPSDGTTADVGDYNTPINTIVNEFNGNIDNNNIKTGAAIDGSKLADTSVTAAKWSFASHSTINAFVEAPNSFSTASTTVVQVTGLSLTITVPTGGGTYAIAISSPSVYNSGSNYTTVDVYDGTVGSGTKIMEAATFGANGTAIPFHYERWIPLTAGAHTLNVGLFVNAGTGNMASAGASNRTSFSIRRVL